MICLNQIFLNYLKKNDSFTSITLLYTISIWKIYKNLDDDVKQVHTIMTFGLL